MEGELNPAPLRFGGSHRVLQVGERPGAVDLVKRLGQELVGRRNRLCKGATRAAESRLQVTETASTVVPTGTHNGLGSRIARGEGIGEVRDGEPPAGEVDSVVTDLAFCFGGGESGEVGMTHRVPADLVTG